MAEYYTKKYEQKKQYPHKLPKLTITPRRRKSQSLQQTKQQQNKLSRGVVKDLGVCAYICDFYVKSICSLSFVSFRQLCVFGSMFLIVFCHFLTIIWLQFSYILSLFIHYIYALQVSCVLSLICHSDLVLHCMFINFMLRN